MGREPQPLAEVITINTSPTLRQWRNAHLQASRAAPERVAEWAEERDWLYTLLDADDKVIADRERVLPLR